MVLVYRGSTTTGWLAIQSAKASGYRVIATSSPRSFDKLRQAGADEVYDYKSHSSASDIRRSTSNSLNLIMDCVGVRISANFCEEATSTNGGKYVSLLSTSTNSEKIVDKTNMTFTALGEDMELFKKPFPAVPGDKAFIEEFSPIIDSLLAKEYLNPVLSRISDQ